MDKIRILLADDDPVFCHLAGDLLRENGYLVETARNTELAIEAMHRTAYDIIMLDLCYPALVDGFNLLDIVRRMYPQIIVLMVSGTGSVPDVVRAIRHGASDFIEKPIEPVHLLLRIKNMSERILKERQLRQLQQSAIGMVGVSAQMQQVFAGIVAAAKLDVPVLITGETGVGKELASRAVHRLSAMGSKDLVCINCASVPKDLYTKDLAGEERETQQLNKTLYQNYLKLAVESSVFLDEISELPLSVQTKLLFLMVDWETEILRGKALKIPRFISATNQDLAALVHSGDFREDLHCRLKTFHIHIPPLRQHPDDIPPLAVHFLNNFVQRSLTLSKEISPRALVWLSEQQWEGNIRELKHCIERAVILSNSNILQPEDFLTLPPEPSHRDTPVGTLRNSLIEYETHLIKLHLKINNFNISQTAKQLGIDKSNLWKRIRTLGIELPG